MSRPVLFLLLCLAAGFAACQPHASDDHATHGSSAAVDDHAAHAADSSDHEAMALRPIMQRLGVSMGAFTQAMWVSDYPRMATYAHEIAGHAHISPEEMQRIRDVLGAEMDAFNEADEAVHDAAVRLHAAAEARDMDAVLRHLGEVQTGCMACHTRFRERLRTDQFTP